jgi:hypothetical protein
MLESLKQLPSPPNQARRLNSGYFAVTHPAVGYMRRASTIWMRVAQMNNLQIIKVINVDNFHNNINSHSNYGWRFLSETIQSFYL